MDLRETQAALAWSSLPFVGERSLVALLDHAREARRGLADLWETPLDDLRAFVRLHPRAARELAENGADRWRQAAEDAEAARRRGVDLLLAADADYPPALQEAPRRWPLVFAYGALGLLDEPRVAIVNSRSPSHAALAATDALADALARRDTTLVTSTNKEAYQAAAVAAKRHAGPAVLVLDRGFAEALPAGLEREPVAAARVWDETFDPELQLLLSPFGWRERWHPRAGPRRDALLFDLADVVIAVDVQTGGTMDRECRAAAGRGKPVLALDQGERTMDGTRWLWEEAGAARTRWAGAEQVAATVLQALPGGGVPAGGDGDRPGLGWCREIAQFMARACARTEVEAMPRRGTGAYPATGVMAAAAARWSPRQVDGTAGLAWLLADLTDDGSRGVKRLSSLLERVTPGGCVAALVPSAWLEDAALAGARAEWLTSGALRLAVRLPHPAGAGRRPPAAVVILQRAAGGTQHARTFAPGQERMGRFHLRRYLQEVLEAAEW